MWIKSPNSGRPDALLTMSVYAVAAILLKFLFSEMNIGPVTFGQLDAGVVGAILASTLGAYVARKHSDNITINKQQKSKEDNNESK